MDRTRPDRRVRRPAPRGARSAPSRRDLHGDAGHPLDTVLAVWNRDARRSDASDPPTRAALRLAHALRRAGVASADDLERIGAAEIYRRVRSLEPDLGALHPAGELSLLYALFAAPRGLPWHRLPEETKRMLRARLTDAERRAARAAADAAARGSAGETAAKSGNDTGTDEARS